MNYSSFRRHVGKAGLTINQFAGLLGVKPGAVSNHKKEDKVPTKYALLAVCLGELSDRGIDIMALLIQHEAVPETFWQDLAKDPVVQIDMFRLNKSESS